MEPPHETAELRRGQQFSFLRYVKGGKGGGSTRKTVVLYLAQEFNVVAQLRMGYLPPTDELVIAMDPVPRVIHLAEAPCRS